MTELNDKISLRDYFAAQAMAALIPLYAKHVEYDRGRDPIILQSIEAYECADAMLSQRDHAINTDKEKSQSHEVSSK